MHILLIFSQNIVYDFTRLSPFYLSGQFELSFFYFALFGVSGIEYTSWHFQLVIGSDR